MFSSTKVRWVTRQHGQERAKLYLEAAFDALCTVLTEAQALRIVIGLTDGDYELLPQRIINVMAVKYTTDPSVKKGKKCDL